MGFGFIPWDQCLAALNDTSLKLFQAWRLFSWDYCCFMRADRLLGNYQDPKTSTEYFCYPVFGPGGWVIAEQIFTQSTSPTIPKTWFTEGAKGNLTPLVVGALPHAKRIFITEGGHDGHAFFDRSGLWKDPHACFIATRGAGGAKLLADLPWPEANGSGPPEIVLLGQNDSTPQANGLTANQRWTQDVIPFVPFPYYQWNPPAGIKDFNDWTRGAITENELLHELDQLKSSPPADPAPTLIELISPSEVKAYQPPPGVLLVGDKHIVRGNIFVIAGAPGVGKSRVSVALAEAAAFGYEWLGLIVHCHFSIVIIQNENGRYRLQQEFAQLDVSVLDQYVRISPPPRLGLCFHKQQFRDQLKKLFDHFPPAVVILDPWNAVAHDDKQKDYAESFELVQQTMPSGDDAPALGIIAHTRKPHPGERANGRSLLTLVAGSHILTSVPRTVWVLQNASDNVTDNRVVVTCCKNNDGELGPRSVWERDNGLWTGITNFDWQSFDNPKPAAKGDCAIDEGAMATVFEFGYKSLKLEEARDCLMQLTGKSRPTCYRALKLDGKFKDNLIFDKKTGLYSWRTI